MTSITSQHPVSERIAALRELMRAKAIDACIVPTGDPHMSEYISDHYKSRQFITGFTGSAGTAVITAEQAGLWTDSRYFLQAADELEGSGVILFKSGLPETVKIPAFLSQSLSDGTVISFDGRLVSSAWADRLRADLAKAAEDDAATDCRFVLRTDLDLVDEIWEDRPQPEYHAIAAYPLQYAGVSRADKLHMIRAEMKNAGADALILSSLSDIAWLTNLRGSDILCNPVFFSFVILTQEETRLYVEPLALDDAVAEELRADSVTLLPYAQFYEDLPRIDVTGASVVMLDRETISERIAQALPDSVKILNRYSPVMQKKCVKNETEIKGVHSAHLKDGVAMCKFLYWLKHNVGSEAITEISAAEKLHALRAEQELFMGDSFEAIVGYGPHAAIVHYCASPESDAVLKPRGMVLIDSGGQYLDGTTDITRTIVLGPVSDREKQLFTAVLRGHINLARAVFPKGLSGANLDYLAHVPLWEMGLDYRHSTGHGVGHYLNVHEDPNEIYWDETDMIPPMPPFEAGMLTSDEPGYYEEGAFGIRHESLLLSVVREKTEYGEFMGFEEVTLVPFDLEGIAAEQMQPDEIDYLNRYHETVYEKIAPHLSEAEREWLRAATAEIGV